MEPCFEQSIIVRLSGMTVQITLFFTFFINNLKTKYHCRWGQKSHYFRSVKNILDDHYHNVDIAMYNQGNIHTT
jgi:hypothetical protein